MIKMDLKDAYFPLPSNRKIGKRDKETYQNNQASRGLDETVWVSNYNKNRQQLLLASPNKKPR